MQFDKPMKKCGNSLHLLQTSVQLNLIIYKTFDKKVQNKIKHK